MCFITYWTGCSVDVVRKKTTKQKSRIEDQFKVFPIHKRRDLLEETIKLINSHWPKSRAERLSILGCSKSDLPTSLVVTVRQFLPLQQARDRVIGHLRLVPVPSDDKFCFIESMVVHSDFRGKGIGSFLLSEAEKFCEQELHLKSIYLSTYDSGEFYMKIGFSITSAICVFGNGEINTTTKKIFLKKDLNYIEPEVVEEVHVDIYDPSKDYNYKQQQLIEPDIVLSGFPFKMEQSKGIVLKLCQLLDFDSAAIRYFYSFEFFNRKTERRSFHMIISTASADVKKELLDKLDAFGVLCFQNFFDKPVNEYDNTLIRHANRYTNLNFAIKKELEQMIEDERISDFKYDNFQFHAKQNDEWINVRNQEILDFLKAPLTQDLETDEEIAGWDEERADVLSNNLEKLRQHFKAKAQEDWWPSMRRPSEIALEPFRQNDEKEHLNKIDQDTDQKKPVPSWISKLQTCDDAVILGVSLENF